MSRFLLAEDDSLVGTMVRMNLESEGHRVRWCKDGQSALQEATTSHFDLLLLDVGLPGLDGFQLLKALREQGVGSPVLMLTALSDVPSKVKALELGADDYLPKPFDVAEMIARVNALVRRARAERVLPADRHVNIGAHALNLETRQASSNEGSVTLTEKESAILELLARAGGRVVSRADILEEVWGMDASPSERTVDNFLLRLRKLFEPDPRNPRHVLTVRGAGYRFVP